MPLEIWKSGITQFFLLGTRAMEITGGGEPVLYPFINEGIDYFKNLGMHLGMNTNGINPELVDDWDAFDWVRVSLNTLDYRDTLDLSKFMNSKAEVTFCYIWNELSDGKISDIIDFANRKEIICRLAPDCIIPPAEIEKKVNHMREALASYKDNKFVFLSDFNIDTVRPNDNCLIHLIKPCFYTDGFVYSCPSSELAHENESQMQDSVRICKWDKIWDTYSDSDSIMKIRKRACSYCKYVKQEDVLEQILTETTFNEFA
jgi:hypothetical protein